MNQTTVTADYLSRTVDGFSALNNAQQQRILNRISIFVAPSDLDNMVIKGNCFSYRRRPLGSNTYHVAVDFDFGK